MTNQTYSNLRDIPTSGLPRVTYSNAGVDFSPLHTVLDLAIPLGEKELLDRERPNIIAGEFDTEGSPYTSQSPIDREISIATSFAASRAAVGRATRAARDAFPHWSHTPWQDRVKVLRKAADIATENKLALGVAALIEVGKSRIEAMGEAEECIDLINYYCDEVERCNCYGQPLRRAFEHESTESTLLPIGVFAVVSPFNFPLALSINMLVAVVLTGNTAVYKPSPHASLTGSLIMDAFARAGLPAGVVNMVCGDAEVGEALASHPDIDGAAFTGSFAVGKKIRKILDDGRWGRPTILEMGGKNPCYVTASADLETAISGVKNSCLGLQGQKCTSTSKVYVDKSLYNEFVDGLKFAFESVEIGDPRERNVFMGPVINEATVDRIERASAEAKKTGKLHLGGERLEGKIFEKGPYIGPTLVSDTPYNLWINKDELFGPFCSVLPMESLEHGMQDGNSVIYGLASGIYTEDINELNFFLDHVKAGAVYANRPSGSTTGAWPGMNPLVGWKSSGGGTKGGLGPWYLPQFMIEQSRTVIMRS